VPEPGELLLLRLARRAENDHTLLQGPWPAQVPVLAAPASIEAATLPYAFARAFAPIGEGRLRPLAAACRLLDDVGRLPPAGALAAQLEAHALLAGLFPNEPRVWEALRAVAVRAAWASTRRDLETDEDLAEAARDAVAVPRFTVAALALLARDEGPRALLDDAVDRYAEARARIEAVLGWRNDRAARRATYVTVALARAGSTAAQALYADGIALRLVDDARAALAPLERRLPVAVAREWIALGRLAQQAARMRATLTASPP
jgi:hypothetical protein